MSNLFMVRIEGEGHCDLCSSTALSKIANRHKRLQRIAKKKDTCHAENAGEHSTVMHIMLQLKHLLKLKLSSFYLKDILIISRH